MKELIYTSRSISGCLKEAAIVALSNLKRILKHTALPIFFLSVALTIVLLSFVPNKQIHDYGITHLWGTFIMLIVSYTMLVASAIWTISSAFRLINGTPKKVNLLRAATIMFVLMILGIICWGLCKLILLGVMAMHLSATTSLIVSLVAIGLFLVLCLVFLLPFHYSFTHYLIEPSMKLRNLLMPDYAIGLRHWGFIFLSRLVTNIIIGVLVFVAMTPLVIIMFANLQNALGTLNGDTDGTPGYFQILLIVSSIMCCFISITISLWGIFVASYVYGSIATQEVERKQQTDIIN